MLRYADAPDCTWFDFAREIVAQLGVGIDVRPVTTADVPRPATRPPYSVLGHGAQLLISAGALNGRTVTCSPGIRDDVRAAGAFYRDEAAVTDGHLLTGRGADDLPQFCQQLIAFLSVRA